MLVHLDLGLASSWLSVLFSVFRATYRQLEKLVAFCRIMPDLGAHVVSKNLVEEFGGRERDYSGSHSKHRENHVAALKKAEIP